MPEIPDRAPDAIRILGVEPDGRIKIHEVWALDGNPETARAHMATTPGTPPAPDACSVCGGGFDVHPRGYYCNATHPMNAEHVCPGCGAKFMTSDPPEDWARCIECVTKEQHRALLAEDTKPEPEGDA